MGERIPRLEIVATILSVLLAFLLLLLRAASEAVMEMGDGVNHYLIARYAWVHHHLFLDLWGKPLFTLLASPFAQLGHVGIAGFNAIVAALTACTGIRCLRQAGGVAQVIFIVLVLLVPQYVLMVLAGMTEPLFGLLTVVVVALLYNERYVAAAAIASLSPLARPEYVVFLPCIMLWLVWQRQWRALPLTLSGLAVYAIAATIQRGEPLWFWTGDPYSYADGAYGSGPLDFFVARAEVIYGRPLLTLGLGALLLWPLVQWRDATHRRSHRLMFLCAALPVLGMFVVHSVLWYKGWRGSAGLLRVLVTSIPLAALFAAFTIGRGAMLLFRHRITMLTAAWLLLPILSIWAMKDLIAQVQLPVQPEANQRFLDATAKVLQRRCTGGTKVFSTHSYMAFRAGMDPFDVDRYFQLFRPASERLEAQAKPGDLLIWDSHFGSNEAGLPLETLLANGDWAVVGAFEPPEASRVLGGHVYELFLFERRDAQRSFTVDTLIFEGMVRDVPAMRADTVLCMTGVPRRWCLKEGEFPLEIRELPPPGVDHIYDELIVSGNAIVEDGSRLTLVYTQQADGHGVRYDQEDVVSGPFTFNRRIPPMEPGIEQSLYFWNLGGKPFSLDGLTILRKRWTQHPA